MTKYKAFNTPEMQEYLHSLLVQSEQDDAKLDKEYHKLINEYKYKRKYGDVSTPGKRLRPSLGNTRGITEK